MLAFRHQPFLFIFPDLLIIFELQAKSPNIISCHLLQGFFIHFGDGDDDDDHDNDGGGGDDDDADDDADNEFACASFQHPFVCGLLELCMSWGQLCATLANRPSGGGLTALRNRIELRSYRELSAIAPILVDDGITFVSR